MNCPYCDMFTPSSKICVHCGEKLLSAPSAKRSRSLSSTLGSGSFIKILYILILIGVVYGVFSLFLKEKDIPAYMNDGPVHLKELIVRGETNIVDFYSEYCPPCRQIAPLLKSLDGRREDISVVKIDINRSGVEGIDWQSPVARQFNLKSIPHFIIVSPVGKLKFQGRKAYKFVLGQLREEGLI